jgi:hypothetical protein
MRWLGPLSAIGVLQQCQSMWSLAVADQQERPICTAGYLVAPRAPNKHEGVGVGQCISTGLGATMVVVCLHSVLGIMYVVGCMCSDGVEGCCATL